MIKHCDPSSVPALLHSGHKIIKPILCAHIMAGKNYKKIQSDSYKAADDWCKMMWGNKQRSK